MVRPGQLVGQVLGGRYRLIGTLGEGGVGTVYEAREEELGRKVAVKVLHLALASDPSWARRMEREARATAALDHPNIVQVTDFQLTAGGLPFLVMERLTGMSFAALIEKEAPIAVARVVNIALQTLDALGVAHRAGIVHRDIKPENIFLVATPATPDFVKVLDFGIAKAIEGMETSGALSMTHTGAVLGTAGYMPPEQARGEPLDARADIFAVGACMYEALAGRTASADANTAGAASLRSIRTPKVEDVSALARRRPDLDPALTAIVTRALSHAPDARYASAQEMIDALRAIGARPRAPSQSELAPTDPMALPIVATTPRAPQAVTPPPHLTRRPPPPMPPRPASSAIGWIVAALVSFFVLVPGCILLTTVMRARSRTREIAPLPDPPPGPSARIPSRTEDDDDDDAKDEDDLPPPRVTAPRSAPRRLTPTPAPNPPPNPVPAPLPTPTPTPSSSRPPGEDPPELLSARATFVRALQIDDQAELGRLRSFVIGTVSPMTKECFRQFGFSYQKGKALWSDVQLTIHSDGTIDSFVELSITGMHQVDCVKKRVEALTAPGVCRSTKPPSCTFTMKLEGTYR